MIACVVKGGHVDTILCTPKWHKYKHRQSLLLINADTEKYMCVAQAHNRKEYKPQIMKESKGAGGFGIILYRWKVGTCGEGG